MTPDLPGAAVLRTGGAVRRGCEGDMERLYYIQREHETAETSDRFEAARIAAEWARRGYKVSAIAVDVTDDAVKLADSAQEPVIPVRPGRLATA